jgi:hypothetical protein
MPVLSATFQILLEDVEPGLIGSLYAVGFSAADSAVEWMGKGFVQVLEVEEVLLLWDRVIGFDSLLVFAVAAAGLFAWRASLLRDCGDEQEARAVLEDMAGVQIVPLLQTVLFLSDAKGEKGRS